MLIMAELASNNLTEPYVKSEVIVELEKVLDELRYYKMNNQICIVNQETLNRVITFKRAYEVKDHGR